MASSSPARTSYLSTLSTPPASSTPILSPSNPSPDTTFAFPPFYSFPPFFTLQPSATTQHAQIQKWGSLILAYTRAHRIFRLSLIDALDTPLFHNTRLNRKLSLSDAREMVDGLRKIGRAEWIDGAGSSSKKDKNIEANTSAWIWWRTPEEWAEVLYAWIEDTAQKGSVLTLYELVSGEGTRGQEFYGMDVEILQRALAVLVKKGKAQVFGQEDQQGVKFF